MPIILHARDLHWLEETPDADDLCAHGRVDFRVNGEVPAGWKDFEVNVSAAALYLLRTLERDTPVSVDGDEIFPCCGHAMYARDDSRDVLILGCNVHNTFVLRHVGGVVEIDIGTGALHPKMLPSVSSDAAGYAAFLGEWEARRGIALV